MQSILQSRRFKRNLQEQIQRHGVAKVAAAISHEVPAPLSTTRSRRHAPSNAGLKDQATTSLPTSSARDYAVEEKPDVVGQHEPAVESRPKPIDPSNLPTSPSRTDEDIEKQNELSGTTPTACSSASSETGYETEDDNDRQENLRPTGTRLVTSMTGVSVRSRDDKAAPGTRSHIFIIGYQGENDELNPHNWTTTRRMIYTLIIASIGFIVGLASSIDSAAIPQASREFGVSEVTESLATGLYLVGFGFGAFFAAPISETVGRNFVYLSTGVMYMIFVMASGLAPNIGAQLAFRLLAGFFGSTPLTCAGGSISDLWNAEGIPL